jgi:uncharacterized protein (TIGR02284 family)
MTAANTNRDVKHDIKVLNSLIETTLDSADGYREAAEKTPISTHRDLFQRWATDRRQVVTELQGQVRTLGGKPDEDGSILAAGHRVFLKIRDSVTKGDDSVVDEVERGEDFIKAKYEDALGDDELSASVRDIVVRAYSSVRTGHDQARDLKRSVHTKQ